MTIEGKRAYYCYALILDEDHAISGGQIEYARIIAPFVGVLNNGTRPTLSVVNKKLTKITAKKIPVNVSYKGNIRMFETINEARAAYEQDLKIANDKIDTYMKKMEEKAQERRDEYANAANFFLS